MKGGFWHFDNFREKILEGDEDWASVRLLGAIGLMMLIMIVGGILQWLNLSHLFFARGEFSPTHYSFSTPFNVFFFLLSIARYAIPPLAAIVIAILGGMIYVQDIFEFDNFRASFNYMIASLFGFDYPTLTIRNGAKDLKPDEKNTMDKIGGPGYLIVKLGNVVLMERGIGPTRVLGAGKHFIRRFETIRGILDLHEIYRNKAKVEVTTKDGIEVTLRNVEATFRLDTGKQQQRTEIEPYPFSVKAVKTAIYDRPVIKKKKDGVVELKQEDWGDVVMNAISERIGNWVTRQRLDKLTAPADEDPRAALRAEFAQKKAREQLKDNLGAELVWVNFGHLDTPDQVDDQRVETWQSYWRTQIAVTKAQGESIGLAYQDIARAEGQAMILDSISRALQESSTALNTQQLADLVLLRISTVIEAMSASPGLSEWANHSREEITDRTAQSTPPAPAAEPPDQTQP